MARNESEIDDIEEISVTGEVVSSRSRDRVTVRISRRSPDEPTQIAMPEIIEIEVPDDLAIAWIGDSRITNGTRVTVKLKSIHGNNVFLATDLLVDNSAPTPFRD